MVQGPPTHHHHSKQQTAHQPESNQESEAYRQAAEKGVHDNCVLKIIFYILMTIKWLNS
jgi:hypothetical protein